MKTVVIGMSGGVDSSTSAYLLKEKGYNVIAVFMQNWDPALNGDLADPYIENDICQAEIDYQDALAVCQKLDIKLHRVNFVQEYWDKVFQYFLGEYKAGRTPNPDIFCNKYIKFDSFLNYALENFEADYIAMGHYAQVVKNSAGKTELIRGLDTNKDQTYFLSQLSQEQIDKVLFPIGAMEKTEVRKIAEEQGLATAKKKDSTGICFIGERNFGLFLNSYLTEKKGKILDFESRTLLGEHKGLFHYTIGQRKGLNLGGNKNFEGKSWFVVGKNLEKNELYVSQQESFLESNSVIVDELNLLVSDLDLIQKVQFRYRSKAISVVEITVQEQTGEKITSLKIKYKTSLAITPGQGAVFYKGNQCLGGGIIKSVYNDGVQLEV